VSVVPVSPVIVPCGGPMLQRGRGGDALLRVLCLMEPRGEAGGGLSSSVICAFYIHVHCLSLVLVERVSSCFELDGHCWVTLGWNVLSQAGCLLRCVQYGGRYIYHRTGHW
jgi:hypothetical protein